MPTPDELVADPRFPWTRGLEPKVLGPRQVPEPERAGLEPDDCPLCQRSDDDYLWADEHWRLLPYDGIPLRGCVILEARRHADSFVDLTPDETATLGPVLARIEDAVLSIGEVGRVHVARWGEGIAHFHQWVMPRPLGVMELRGPSLMAWMDALPPHDPQDVEDAHASIGSAMQGIDS
jgi:diadenosine tetraphosphate (Ap4A) HIT family hydrolase